MPMLYGTRRVKRRQIKAIKLNNKGGMMKYKVTHRDGVEVIEADSYEAEGLCTARKVTFIKEGIAIKMSCWLT